MSRRTTQGTVLVWLRHDLRLADHPALAAALKTGRAVVPVFIWAPGEEEPWPPGAASRWWLHQSLEALSRDLLRLGSRLIVRKGSTLDHLLAIARETGASGVYWNRRYEPAIVQRDTRIKEALGAAGLEVVSFNGSLLREPWAVRSKTGGPYQVFTPYWRACLGLDDPAPPLPAPKHLPAPADWPESLPLRALELEPRLNWADGFRSCWRPGAAGAQEQLDVFLRDAFSRYASGRDQPAGRGTSRLSPHLHWGEISPREVWHAARAWAEKTGGRDWRGSPFLTELGWREFAHHLLFHFPRTTTGPLRTEFVRFPWRDEASWLRAWQRGRTGYPIVDAGLRELWSTGWMHNRVRMITASFLVKDLLQPWQRGAAWFWDTLVDADLAANTLGWQWSAGCGADAAPFFRIFNPVTQGEKFDPEGSYVRRWVPELARLPEKWIHRPWEAPPTVLDAAGVRLGGDYPRPLVSHAIAREVALEAYRQLRV